MYEVKKHKGRSSLSVYEWRVYRVSNPATGRTIRTQLAKLRTEEAAQAFLARLEAQPVDGRRP